ncbi:MAG: helix-turn-helix transcriptional regulator [Clostridia bacterium]|nr:helix-turn-helix transcriptional regulator [Clostridia bacterium]
MRILYRQREASPFARLGIRDCYLKDLCWEADGKNLVSKLHHHREFEVHIPVRGGQVYEIDGQEYCLSPGEFLLIPPFCRHRTIRVSRDFRKYSLTFSAEQIPDTVKIAAVPGEIWECVEGLVREKQRNRPYSALIVENRTLELLLLLLRQCGLKEDVASAPMCEEEDERLILAKKYISDNLDQDLSLSDISAYCHLSARQLARIFLSREGVSPTRYLLDRRLAVACAQIRDTDLPLKQISASVGFSNEYYFNSVFKRHMGIPPGMYRAMYRKG